MCYNHYKSDLQVRQSGLRVGSAKRGGEFQAIPGRICAPNTCTGRDGVEKVACTTTDWRPCGSTKEFNKEYTFQPCLL